MPKFLLRRLASSLILVAIAASLAYVLAATSLNPRANFEGRNPPPPPAVVDRQLSALNLNDRTPVAARYATWLGGLARADFGKTWDGISVNAEMARRIGVSLRLLIVATVLGGLFGVLAGASGAMNQHRFSDRAVTLLSFLVLSIPVFVLAVLFEIVAVGFNTAVGANVFAYTGEFTPGLEGGFFAQAVDRLQHLVLPTFTLALAQIAIFSRYQRNAMLDVLGSDYVRTARAKGLPRRTAMLRHALRTSLIPSATFFAFNLALLFVGATFVETIFGWHGMGEWLVESVTRNDVNAVAAVSCFTAVLVLGARLLAELVHAYLDPRIRVGA